MGVFVVFFFAFDSILMPWYVTRGGSLLVPDVTSLPFEEAKVKLDSLGLQPRQGDIRPDPQHPEGTVILQNPSPGTKVKLGRRVYLTLSGGEILVEVPSLKGRSSRDSKFALERNGLKLGSESYEVSNDFPTNTIIEQSIPANTKVKKGTFVSVTISQGPATERILVPEVIGKTLGEAEKLLLQRRLKLGNITYQVSPDLLPNTVIEQYPRSGDFVSIGQAIDLFVVQAGTKKPKQLLEN